MDPQQFTTLMDLLCETLTAVVQGSARTAGPDPWLQQPMKMMAEDPPEAYLEWCRGVQELQGQTHGYSGPRKEVSHIDQDCPAMGCDLIRPVPVVLGRDYEQFKDLLAAVMAPEPAQGSGLTASAQESAPMASSSGPT
ncbi:UNVERIFIED_CONTAM: hypothetical protein FKN15_077048 [Acipenser sinensis]